MSAKDQIVKEQLPKHIAIIMDGNGRWAKRNKLKRVFGHKNGVKSVREVTEACAELGLEYLTLYAFSTENWSRPKAEVNALMTLLMQTIRSEVKTLMENNVRLLSIGDIDDLPKKARIQLEEAKDLTADNSGLSLVLALSYSSKSEIIKAVQDIGNEIKKGALDPEDIDEKLFSNHLSTAGIPDPELMIRTSGECRISNFLLWQLAYAELYFTETLWPDFTKEDLYTALVDFQNRERRFGMTSAQLQ